MRQARPDQVTLGPAPKGDRDVGGADADILVDHTLIEVKTVARLARIVRKDLLQLAFYFLLDYDDELRIERVALYLGRQARLAQWTVPEFLALLTGAPADVPALRTKLRADLDHQPR